MSVAQPEATGAESSNLPWYVYDRHLHLLHIGDSLEDAEAWAIEHWEVVEVADRQQVDDHDYWYLLLAAPQESGLSRDYQARIMRQDRVVAVGRDPEAVPRYPEE